MNRSKLYMSGKITGDRDYRLKFLRAENKIFDAGYYPINPASFILNGTEWEKAMREVLKIMLDCDGVALLPDWKESKGAKIEARLACEVGIKVKPIEEWIAEGIKQ